jgi:hypothetical protein
LFSSWSVWIIIRSINFNNASWISGQLGLAVMVIKRSGFWQNLQMAMESWKS